MQVNGGIQYVPQIAVQYVYLDFDGELTGYNGEILTVENVEVIDSKLSAERIAAIVAELNTQYASQNVIFVTGRPTVAEYSTIYIGKTSAFEQYGSFAGLAETIDKGNQIKNDKAFVMLDASSSNESIISTISHETDHLLGTLNHGGEGLAAYAAHTIIGNGVTSTGLTISSGNSVTVSSGGTANSTTVNPWGDMYISSGGIANRTTVNSGGEMRIYSGGTANITTVNYDGYMYISRGGTANYTTVNSDGEMYISRGGTANSTTVNYYGSMHISSGGTANYTTVNSRGNMRIYSGGTANSTTINSGGYMYISSGGTANSTTVNSRGSMRIHRGGTANYTTVNKGGEIHIESGGPAIAIKENGGYVYVAGGANVTFVSNTLAGVTLSFGDNMTVHSNTVANSTTVNSRGFMFIESGGTANNTTVNSGGSMYISRGGTANNTTINGDDDDYYNHGYMFIESGGTANNTTVNSYGEMYISSGGTANNTTVNSKGSMDIESNGTANNTTVNSGGEMYISSGGIANNTTVNSSGYMYILSGGTANNTTVNSYGEMYISSGGTGNRTTINSGGYMYISSGGTANYTTVNSGGYMYIESGGTANSTTINSRGDMYIYSGGIANRTTVYSGYMYIYSGGTANSTTVNSGGAMYIYSGGTADSTTVNDWGYMYIYSGGTANNTVNSCRMYIYSGGVHRGTLQIANGAKVSAYQGAAIDFTVSGRKTTDTYLINDLSRISGTPTYTITVDNNQAYGTYKLAQGAENFSGTVTIGNGTTEFGTITVNGNDFKHNRVTYSLDKAGGNLTLTVEAAAEVVNTDIKNRGYSQILAWDRNRGAVGMADNQGTTPAPWRGVWDWDDKDAALWRVAGAGHFKGTNVDYDGILLYNGVGNRFAAWTDINTGSYGYVNLCKVEGSFNTRSLADLDGNEYDDILIYDETGSFGVVLDGTTYKDIWHVDKGKFNTWDIIGAGKFDNGTDKLVTENNYNHQIYLWTNNDPTFNTWNWSTQSIGTLAKGDEVVAIGDFQGDGIDDIVVQLADGNMWCWDNGNSQTKRWIGNPGDNFTVEAVGDYNGDGKEDILLREQASGWGGLGYWGAGYAGNWTDMKTRIETDTRISGSKFDIIA